MWLTPLTAALCAAGSIPTRNKNLCELRIVVPGVDVCVCKCEALPHSETHNSIYGIPSVGTNKKLAAMPRRLFMTWFSTLRINKK